MRDFTRQQLPQPFIEELLRGMIRAYKRAHFKAEAFGKPHSIDLLPHIRRAEVDIELKRVAQQFDYTKASSQMNAGRNCYHTELRVGKKLVITASAVDKPEQMVRRAEFRLTLASFNDKQLNFFGNEKVIPFGKDFYALLLHGPSEREPWMPGWVDLGYPTPECDDWVEYIQLPAFSNLDINELVREERERKVETVEIQDTAMPMLKTEAKEDEQG